MNRNSIGKEKQNIHQSQKGSRTMEKEISLKWKKEIKVFPPTIVFRSLLRKLGNQLMLRFSNWFRIKLLRKQSVDQGLVSPTPLLIFAENPEEEVVSPLYLKENHLNSRFTRSINKPYYWNYWNDLKRGDPSHLLRFNKRSKKHKKA